MADSLDFRYRLAVQIREAFICGDMALANTLRDQFIQVDLNHKTSWAYFREFRSSSPKTFQFIEMGFIELDNGQPSWHFESFLD